MSNQTSQKRQLVESIKNSMTKSSTSTSPKNTASKKPQNYTSYLNTSIDYNKDHNVTPYLVPTIPRKPQVVYSLDSDESPKEDQYKNNKDQLITGSLEDELMREIQHEIYRGTEEKIQPIEEEENQQESQQRKVTKILGPKRKMNLKPIEDEEEDQPATRNQPKLIPARNNPVVRRTRVNQDQQEQSKITTQQPQTQRKQSMLVRRKSAPYTPYIPSEPVKKMKQTMAEGKPVNFKINVQLLKSNLQIKKIKECDGNTRENVRYVCELEDGQQEVLNNIEMTHLYKDELINYYQNCHFQ